MVDMTYLSDRRLYLEVTLVNIFVWRGLMTSTDSFIGIEETCIQGFQ